MATTQALFGIVEREGRDRGFWTRIGTAFQNQDGSWNLRFDYVPTNGSATIQMRPARVSEEPPSGDSDRAPSQPNG